ncbi:ankyrin-3-like [Triticum dicoccoides]|uniref:ankyrin-3-like n=1 Tax=Triticum dicoccoides TaxID=85692 RepID=UPI0018902F7E|nr:ankyrin-3-like [Triticum dicoccoides]
MASSTGNVEESSSNALAVGLWDAQQLEMMPAGSNDFPAAAGRERKPAPINPLLLASASWTALNYLFSEEDRQTAPMIQPTQVFLDLLVGYPAISTTKGRLTVQQASEDVENVVDQPASPMAGLLLNGVTAEGDTALHVVASHGDGKKFLECATIICKRDQEILFVANKNGDTPLHCAARAGKFQMLSCLVELAESCNRLHDLLRKENVLQETALHDAVRTGNKDIVERLLKADTVLANYPKEGTSPLYLSIFLEKYGIARALYEKSNGNLSYSGPSGQNALHAATCEGSVGDRLWNSVSLIHSTLKLANAKYNYLREDEIEEKDRYKLTPEETNKEAENVKDLSQIIGIGSVLIATVAFGATFAAPGGFIADDHANRGYPGLAAYGPWRDSIDGLI